MTLDSATPKYAHKYDAGSTPSNFDVMARVWQGSRPNDALKISAIDTYSFAEKIFKITRENTLLQATIKNLWNVTKYNREYISFLLGQYSDEEFSAIAQEFATQPDSEVEKHKLIDSIGTIFNIINDESLTSHDLSTILNVDCSLVESTMSSLSPK